MLFQEWGLRSVAPESLRSREKNPGLPSLKLRAAGYAMKIAASWIAKEKGWPSTSVNVYVVHAETPKVVVNKWDKIAEKAMWN